ncbi:hypothetical protein D3C78_1327700 [compost metagenome]
MCGTVPPQHIIRRYRISICDVFPVLTILAVSHIMSESIKELVGDIIRTVCKEFSEPACFIVCHIINGVIQPICSFFTFFCRIIVQSIRCCWTYVSPLTNIVRLEISWRHQRLTALKMSLVSFSMHPDIGGADRRSGALCPAGLGSFRISKTDGRVCVAIPSIMIF